MARVTADDVRELMTSRIMDPTLVEWLNEDEMVTDAIEVVSGVLFTDISYARRNDDYRIIITRNDLIGQNWYEGEPTDEDYAAFAEVLNES